MSFHWKPDAFAKYPKFIEQVRRVVDQSPGLFIRREDGRIAHNTHQQSLDSPWIFIRTDPIRHCQLWNAIYWSALGVLPSFCRFCCWKVVARPQTVRDLFDLYEVFWKLGVNGKVGLDIREYTGSPYGGFIYNDSLKEGQEMLQKVRQTLREHWLESRIPTFLKRGCTEMELAVPSDQWDNVSQEQLEKEQMLNEIFVKTEMTGGASPWLIQDKKHRFIRHALSIGDSTWKELVEDPSSYVPHTVCYDDRETFEASMSPEGDARAYENE